MRYEIRWRAIRDRRGRIEYRPLLPVELRTRAGLARYHFLIDSGADTSMAPRYAFPESASLWAKGRPRILQGASRKRDCRMIGRIHDVMVIVSEANLWLTLPICFVDADVPFVIGRDVFFDHFLICFDKAVLTTILETKGNS